MENYKEVCGNKSKVWFEIKPNESEQFLSWAKQLGCVWISGKQIEPEKGADYLHFSISNEGKLTYVNMMVWFSEYSLTFGIEKYVFSEYIKGVKVEPKSHLLDNL